MGIKAVITDVDGCLTDNGVYMLPGGVARRFNVLDGHAFGMLHEAGIETAMLSASEPETIIDRAKWLKTTYVRSLDKPHWMSMYMQLNKYRPMNVAFMGNDVIDLGALKIVGFAACPNDAHPEVRAYVETRREKDKFYGFVAKKKGGDAAFREFVDYLFYQEFIIS